MWVFAFNNTNNILSKVVDATRLAELLICQKTTAQLVTIFPIFMDNFEDAAHLLPIVI